jgi:hypothetical protein
MPATDAGMETLPAAADTRMVTLLPAADAGAQGFVCGVGASTSPRVIDVDPINAIPGGMDQDLVGDLAQIKQALKDPGTSGAQVPDSSSSGPTLTRWEIDWNGTPWQEDIFDDNKNMWVVRNAIVTLNVALTVSFLLVFFLMTYFCIVVDELFSWNSHWQIVQRVELTC